MSLENIMLVGGSQTQKIIDAVVLYMYCMSRMGSSTETKEVICKGMGFRIEESEVLT